MKKIVWILALAFSFLSIGAQAQQPAQQPAGKDMSWAFPLIVGTLPPSTVEGPQSLPGSTKTYTQAQIEDLANPPDWYPEEHQPAPQIVQHGHDPAFACGACHLMSGMGHPESSSLAGLTVDYTMRQMADFQSKIRKDPALARMNNISGALSQDEMLQAARWFAAMKPVVWTKVVEASTVPKTFVGAGRMRFEQPGGVKEPIGNRIITLPQDPSRVTKRDPHSGFIAYVPMGSIKKGEALVKNGGGGKTIACSICHGDSLQGIGNVPRIAGLHPIYIARQLLMFQNGDRAGGDGQLMKKPVMKLTEEDIVAIAAYIGSQAP